MLKYTQEAYDSMYNAFRAEVTAHQETKEQAIRRLKQIQFLLLEKKQLEVELDQLRETVDKCSLALQK